MAGNLGELILETTQAYSDDIAFQVRRGFRVERLTFGAVEQHARRIASWLPAQGAQPGDRIVVWSPNMPEYAVLYFGAWLAGVVVVPIDVRTRPEVLGDFVASARPILGFKSRFLDGVFPPPVTQTINLENLFDVVADAPPLAQPAAVGADDLCEIAFTSGTTGVPKGVMLTHGNFLAEIGALRQAFPLERRYRALSLLPLSHSLEQVINLLHVFTSGVRLTYVPRVNGVTIVRALREERITCLVAVPELLRIVLAGIERRAQQEGNAARYQFAHRIAPRLPFRLRRVLFRKVHQALGGHLEFFGCGGARLDRRLAEAWQRMGISIYEGYGLTETAAAAAINRHGAQRLGSVGPPLPGFDVRFGEDGEIQLRGPSITPGYWDNPERTAAAFVDGWFRTGDIGHLDEQGYLHISGRDAFKLVLPDGRNVYPEDIERVLNLHPLVQESCVVGVERHGDESVHAVILTETPAAANQIIRETNAQLADHQQIRSSSVWSEPDFPRTPILKVDRKLVRAVVLTEAGLAPAASPAGAETGADGAPPLPNPPPRGGEGTGSVIADPLVALLTRIAERPAEAVRDDAELGADLDLDSIGRVEVLAAVEEELGRVVDELRVGAQTTVAELRALVAAGTTSAAAVGAATWPRAGWARVVRRGLQATLFRLQDRWMQFDVVHPERAATLPRPSILIYNYQGPYAALAVLRVLPPHVRERVVIAADARLWEGGEHWQGILASLGVQAFPFTKSGGAVRASLEALGRWLDDGYAVLMSPEGNPERDGKVLPFLGGTGLMAVEMGVPVVPFRLENYYQLFPSDPQFPFLPSRRGRVRLIIGEPVSIPRNTPYDVASDQLRDALIATR